MPAQGLKTVDALDGIAPLIEACVAARTAFANAKSARSDRPEKLRKAKSKLADIEFRRDALQVQADAGSNVDATQYALLDAEVMAAEADVDRINRDARAESAAIEVLRDCVSEARKALLRATEPQRSAAIKVAREKYAAGIQQLRDAVTILGKLQDELLPIRMKVIDIEPGAYAFDAVTPSPPTVALLLDLDPAVREAEIALREILR